MIQNPKQIPSVKAGVNIFLLNLIECPICNGNRKLRNDIDDATPRGLTCRCNPYILMGIESVKAVYFVREEMPRQSVEVLANEGELQPRAMMNKNWNYRWRTAHFEINQKKYHGLDLQRPSSGHTIFLLAMYGNVPWPKHVNVQCSENWGLGNSADIFPCKSSNTWSNVGGPWKATENRIIRFLKQIGSLEESDTVGL